MFSDGVCVCVSLVMVCVCVSLVMVCVCVCVLEWGQSSLWRW